MDDFYNLTHLLKENRAMMGRFKLEKLDKLWWQYYCRENILKAANVSWEYLLTQLLQNFQNYTYKIEQLNEFLDCSQEARTNLRHTISNF